MTNGSRRKGLALLLLVALVALVVGHDGSTTQKDAVDHAVATFLDREGLTPPMQEAQPVSVSTILNDSEDAGTPTVLLLDPSPAEEVTAAANSAAGQITSAVSQQIARDVQREMLKPVMRHRQRGHVSRSSFIESAAFFLDGYRQAKNKKLEDRYLAGEPRPRSTIRLPDMD